MNIEYVTTFRLQPSAVAKASKAAEKMMMESIAPIIGAHDIMVGTIPIAVLSFGRIGYEKGCKLVLAGVRYFAFKEDSIVATAFFGIGRSNNLEFHSVQRFVDTHRDLSSIRGWGPALEEAHRLNEWASDTTQALALVELPELMLNFVRLSGARENSYIERDNLSIFDEQQFRATLDRRKQEILEAEIEVNNSDVSELQEDHDRKSSDDNVRGRIPGFGRGDEID